MRSKKTPTSIVVFEVIAEVSNGLSLPGAPSPEPAHEPIAVAAAAARMPIIPERESLFGAFARLRRFSFV